RVVVDHEHVHAVLAERAHHALEVLALVVGRQANSRAHVRIIAGVATTLPRNADVAEQLELLADLLEIEGEAAFRVLAYRRADTSGPGRAARGERPESRRPEAEDGRAAAHAARPGAAGAARHRGRPA